MPKAVDSSIRPSPVRTRSVAAQLAVERGRLHHELDPRPQREAAEGVLQRQQGEPARRRRPRHPAVPRLIAAGARVEPVRPAPVRLVEQLDQVAASRPSAARRSRPRRAARAAGSRRRTRPPPRADRRRRAPGATPRPVDRARHVPRPSRPRGPRTDPAPAVGRGATTDAPGPCAVPRPGSGRDQLTGPEGRRADRVALRGRHAPETPTPPPSRARPSAPSVESSQRAAPADRADRPPGRLPRPAAGCRDRVERAFAAVGQGREIDRSSGRPATSRPPARAPPRRPRTIP